MLRACDGGRRGRATRLTFALGLIVGCAEDPKLEPLPPKPKQPQPKLTRPDAAQAQRAPKLDIVFGAGLRGTTDPCGCSKGPEGGLSGRIDIVRAAGDPLVIEGFDTFFAERQMTTVHASQARRAAERIADVLAETKTKVLGVGPFDLSLGQAELRRLAKRAGASLVATNLVSKGKGAAFDRFVTVEHEGIQVGVVSAVATSTAYARHRLEVVAPASALVGASRAARGKGARWVIGLLRMPSEEAHRLIRTLPPGTLDVVLTEPGEESPYLSVAPRGRELALVGLDGSRDPVGITSRIVSVVGKELPGAAAPGHETTSRYVGSKTCGPCHKAARKHWAKTRHAKAWASLSRLRQVQNIDCIGCHATGFDRPGGPHRTVGLAPFVGVGCESCHGPSSMHAKAPEKPVPHPKPGEAICRECHVEQGDQQPFVYARRLRKVLGRGHGQTSQ